LGLAFVRGIARGTTAAGGLFACGNCVFGPVCPFGFGYPPLPLPLVILASNHRRSNPPLRHATRFAPCSQAWRNPVRPVVEKRRTSAVADRGGSATQRRFR
jgi:hypothetical protein